MSDPILVTQSFKANGALYEVGTQVGSLDEGVIVPNDAGLTRGQIEARLPAKVLGLASEQPPGPPPPPEDDAEDSLDIPYEKMTRPHLVAEVLARVNSGRDLNMNPKGTKADFVALLEQDDAAQAQAPESGE